MGKKLTRTEAEAEAERLRTVIRAGEFADTHITTGDIEAYRHHRRTQKRSAVTINHDLELLRKMFAWGIRERLLTATPFKVAGESVIRLDPESPREERLTSEEAERKFFDAASPHLRGVLTAMLETCCRPGEILSLQWRDVDLETREVTIRAEKAKTRRARRLPISSRLLAVLEAASRAGESRRRASCKFLQRRSGEHVSHRRRRSVVHAEQVTGFLILRGWCGRGDSCPKAEREARRPSA